jgi:hypothetical protein
MLINNFIFTPLVSVQANKTRTDGNFSSCTKIIFEGYEISIASDQSLGPGNDLERTEIRVYSDNDNNRDITDDLIKIYNEEHGENALNIFTGPEDLLFIMQTIKSLQTTKDQS